ncbi:MAG: FAD-dependent oxidoreductase, partial [Nitrososphaerales archaeon]
MDKFDVIVVGAGVGGSASALQLARAGLDVLLLDKAKVPGHRNMTGGILFGNYLDNYGMSNLIPNFQKEAPVERQISDHEVYAISDPSKKTSSYKVKSFSGSFLSKLGIFSSDFSTGTDFTILRSKFDSWLAKQALAAGAMLATEISVQDLLFEDKAVIGVITPNETISSKLVIDASGVTSTLVERAGLRERLSTKNIYHGIKHLYSVSETMINEKFRVRDDKFRSMLFLGDFMRGVQGGAFIYPNEESLSVGLV